MVASLKSKAGSTARRAVQIEESGAVRQYQTGSQSITFVPLSIKRRHNRKVLTPPHGETSAVQSAAFDLPMIKTLGKAFYWQRLIDSGEVKTGNELARKLKLEPGWVAEVLRLTLLAPDIVEAILEGRQPRHLHLHVLRGRDRQLPAEWDRQRKALGCKFI